MKMIFFKYAEIHLIGTPLNHSQEKRIILYVKSLFIDENII